MPTSNTESSSTESWKQERSPFFPSTQIKAVDEAKSDTSYALLTVLAKGAKGPTAAAFLVTQAASISAQVTARSLDKSDIDQEVEAPTQVSSGWNLMRSCKEANLLYSSKYQRRDSQMYPTLFAATQMAISTIEENECDDDMHPTQQLTELQYGYCPYWERTRTPSPLRRYQRRNSCIGSMSVPSEKVLTAEDYQYETAEPSSMNHFKSSLEAAHPKVQRRNSQTAAMLYVATQMATIDETWGQLTLEERPSSPSDGSVQTYKRRRFQF